MMDLSKFDDEYAKAEAPAGGGDEPPDGTYHVSVATVDLGHTKTTGDPILKWQLEIQTGPQAGRYLFRNNLFASTSNLSFLKKDLAVCGMTLTKLSDLEKRLEELLDIELEVKKVTKPSASGDRTYSNVYFQKRIAGAPTAAKRNGTAAVGVGSAKGLDEDLPF